jgi:Protein of unknown function (DUF3999)
VSRVLASFLVLGAASLAHAQDPRREDFAYSIAVRPSAEAPLYRVRLPLSVYRSITRDDLGDLRVFNGAGSLVPHELWMPDDDEIERRIVPLRVFPLREATPEELSSIRVRIESGAESASILLAPGSAPAAVSAYLIDPGPIEHRYPAARLVLHWSEPTEGFVRELRVEESDDLASWRPNSSAVVADLRRNGERLLRNDVPLPSRIPRYLKIASGDRPLPMTLQRIDLELSSRVVETSWLEVEELRQQEDGLHFETPGPVLVEEMDVVPVERNTWTEVKLFSRREAKTPWVLRGSGAVYRFAIGADTRLDVEATRDRFWKLTTDETRGGFGGSTPALRAGYRPDDVVFVARGEPPFEIAFGKRGLDPPPRSSDGLRVIGSVRDGRFAPSTQVTLGERRTIAGERALQEPLIPDWKRFVLWAVLASASLALLLTSRAALRNFSSISERG